MAARGAIATTPYDSAAVRATIWATTSFEIVIVPSGDEIASAASTVVFDPIRGPSVASTVSGRRVRQGRRRGHQPGTARRYASYSAPKRRRSVGSSYQWTKDATATHEGGRVGEQDPPAEQQRLADDRGGDGEVHRVPDVAVEPADDEPLGRRDGRRRPDPLGDEARERLQQDDDSGREEERAHDSERQPRRGFGRVPARQQPRDETRDDARRHDEEDEAPESSPRPGHRPRVRLTCSACR